MPAFARLVSQERKRLEKIRQQVLARKAGIDREMEHVQRELAAIGRFFSNAVSSTGLPARRARRGERRQQILDAIKPSSEGLTRGEIIKKLNAVDKSAQQSISNALNNLLKAKALKRDNGRYRSP